MIIVKAKSVISAIQHGARLAMDPYLPPARRATEAVVAGMATMPSRFESFYKAFNSVVRQVDRIYLYLDGFEDIPEQIKSNKKVRAFLSKDYPSLHANGKFLGMIFEESPCYYLSVDDDIYYCRDYAQRLIDKIDENGRKVAVGFHGYNLQRPFQRYTTGREVFYFQSKLAKTRTVDIIGTGTSAVWTGTLRFDVREWQYTNMVDPCFALEAARVAMPLLCIARPAKRLVTLDRNPKNAIWERALKDDSVQTELCREVLYLKQQKRDSHVQ